MMSNGLSEYERQRLENIKQNQEILKSLNIKAIIPEELKKSPVKAKRPVVKKSKSEEESAAVEEDLTQYGRRVSSRLLKKAGVIDGEDSGNNNTNLEEERALLRKPSVPVPPKPKRIVGKITFDPENGDSSSNFLELTNSLNSDFDEKKEPRRRCDNFANNLEIQNEHSVIKVMRERIYSVAVHPDPSKVFVAAGGKSGELSFLDATEAAHPVGLKDRQLPEPEEFHPPVFTFKPHTGSISNLRYNPFNTVKLYSTSYDNLVRSMDLTTGTFDELYNFEESSKVWITGFDVEGSGNVFHLSDSVGLYRCTDLRLEGDKIVREAQLHEKKIGGLSVCRDGRYLATASNDGSVKLWDLRKFNVQEPEALHTLTFRYTVTSVQFNPVDSTKLISTCYDDHVRIHYNMTGSADQQRHVEIGHNNQTGRWITNFKAAWDQKTPNYAVVGNMNRGIDVINADADREHDDYNQLITNITSDYLTAQPAVNSFHPSLDLIASGNASGKIAIWSHVL